MADNPVGGRYARLRGFLALVPPSRWVSLLAIMLLCSLTDGIGLLMLVPMLQGLSSSGGLIDTASSTGLLRLWRWFAWPTPTLGQLLALFVFLVLLRALAQWARDALSQRLQHRIVDGLRKRSFAALLGARWDWLAQTRQSDHVNLLVNDINRIGTGLHFALHAATALVTLLVYVAVAFSLSWRVTLLATLSGWAVLALLGKHRRAALQLGHGITHATQDLQQTVQEALAGIKLSKIVGNEAQHQRRLQNTLHVLRAQQWRFSQGVSQSQALFQVLGATLLAGYLYLGHTQWHTPLPTLLVLVLVFSRLIPQGMAMHQQWHHTLHALPSYWSVDGLLREAAVQAEPAGPETATRHANLLPLREAIELRDVVVHHPGRAQPVLGGANGLSVRFAARQTTAIIGESGAGKSTLADVLMGLRQPTSGQFCLDGEPMDAVHVRWWRRQVAYVPQETFLFHDSIRRNLAWSAPTASEQDLRQALGRAAAEFVFALPQGLDTVVGDGGVRLSGGERQRIALARALLGRPNLLILDEATSALDVENEARVRRAIEQLHGDLTVVIIGHRLATLQHADHVIELQDGRVRAQGTWDEVSRALTERAMLNGVATFGESAEKSIDRETT